MSRPAERGARIASALAALLLVALALATLLPVAAPRGAGAGDLWPAIAPPATVAMPPWRWVVLSAGARQAHLRLAPSHADPARLEALAAWRLQRPVPGFPADAVVVRVDADAADAAVEARLAELSAALLARIPTLAAQRLGADRQAPPPGLDAERLRFLVRDRMGR
jgi:hypothetical protein